MKAQTTMVMGTLALLLLGTPGTARAQQASGAAPQKSQVDDPYAGLDHTGTPSGPDQEHLLPGQSAPSGVKRRAPNYSGARPRRLTCGQVLIWIPRALLYPVYLTLEYAVRWPVVKLLTILEKHHVIERVKSIFVFADGKATWLPTFLKEIGRFNQVGGYFQYRGLGVPGHTLTVQAALWTGHWYHAKVIDQLKVFRRDQGTLTFRGEFAYRPDSVFFGLGPDTVDDARSFYRIRQAEVALSLHAQLGGLNRFTGGVSYRNVAITGGRDVSVDSPERAEYWDVTDPAQVPGFGETYNLISTTVRLDLDSRSPKRIDTPGSGVRLEVQGSHHVDPGNHELHFANWSGELAAFWDTTGRNNVLALRAYVAGQERIGQAPVPIHERLALGGNERLRAFPAGRFRGDSAFVVTAQYQYPIWWMLDANLYVGAGNVFTGRFDDFAFRRMVMSWGIGVRTNSSKDVSFDVLLAFGSNPLGQWAKGVRVDNIRLLFGINQGF